jgi:hypothetical protein
VEVPQTTAVLIEADEFQNCFEKLHHLVVYGKIQVELNRI